MTDPVTPPEGYEPDPLFSGKFLRDPPSRAQKRRKKYSYPQKRAKAKVFMDLPQRERRRRAASMKWRIQQNPDGRGLFCSYTVLPGSRFWPDSEAPHLRVSNIVFLPRGPQPAWFYNATVETVAHRWAQDLVAHVETAVQAALTPEDLARKRDHVHTYSKRMPDGGSQLWFAPDPVFASLGGRTQKGAQAAFLREHWDELATLVPGVGESCLFKEDRKEWKGVGTGVQHGRPLHLITAEPTLSVDGVVRALQAFAARGEQPYQEPAVDFDTVRATVEAILRVQLWRWETHEARSKGTAAPADPDPRDVAIADDSGTVDPSWLGQGRRRRKGKKPVRRRPNLRLSPIP